MHNNTSSPELGSVSATNIKDGANPTISHVSTAADQHTTNQAFTKLMNDLLTPALLTTLKTFSSEFTLQKDGEHADDEKLGPSPWRMHAPPLPPALKLWTIENKADDRYGQHLVQDHKCLRIERVMARRLETLPVVDKRQQTMYTSTPNDFTSTSMSDEDLMSHKIVMLNAARRLAPTAPGTGAAAPNYSSRLYRIITDPEIWDTPVKDVSRLQVSRTGYVLPANLEWRQHQGCKDRCHRTVESPILPQWRIHRTKHGKEESAQMVIRRRDCDVCSTVHLILKQLSPTPNLPVHSKMRTSLPLEHPLVMKLRRARPQSAVHLSASGSIDSQHVASPVVAMAAPSPPPSTALGASAPNPLNIPSSPKALKDVASKRKGGGRAGPPAPTAHRVIPKCGKAAFPPQLPTAAADHSNLGCGTAPSKVPTADYDQPGPIASNGRNPSMNVASLLACLSKQASSARTGSKKQFSEKLGFPEASNSPSENLNVMFNPLSGYHSLREIAVLQQIASHCWPMNQRQLQNIYPPNRTRGRWLSDFEKSCQVQGGWNKIVDTVTECLLQSAIITKDDFVSPHQPLCSCCLDYIEQKLGMVGTDESKPSHSPARHMENFDLPQSGEVWDVGDGSLSQMIMRQRTHGLGALVNVKRLITGLRSSTADKHSAKIVASSQRWLNERIIKRVPSSLRHLLCPPDIIFIGVERDFEAPTHTICRQWPLESALLHRERAFHVLKEARTVRISGIRADVTEELLMARLVLPFRTVRPIRRSQSKSTEPTVHYADDNKAQSQQHLYGAQYCTCARIGFAAVSCSAQSAANQMMNSSLENAKMCLHCRYEAKTEVVPPVLIAPSSVYHNTPVTPINDPTEAFETWKDETVAVTSPLVNRSCVQGLHSYDWSPPNVMRTAVVCTAPTPSPPTPETLQTPPSNTKGKRTARKRAAVLQSPQTKDTICIWDNLDVSTRWIQKGVCPFSGMLTWTSCMKTGAPCGSDLLYHKQRVNPVWENGEPCDISSLVNNTQKQFRLLSPESVPIFQNLDPHVEQLINTRYYAAHGINKPTEWVHSKPSKNPAATSSDVTFNEGFGSSIEVYITLPVVEDAERLVRIINFIRRVALARKRSVDNVPILHGKEPESLWANTPFVRDELFGDPEPIQRLLDLFVPISIEDIKASRGNLVPWDWRVEYFACWIVQGMATRLQNSHHVDAAIRG